MMQQTVVAARVLPHYQRILYVMDGSPSSRRAGEHAVFLAQRAQAQLIVLCLLPDSITRRLSAVLRRVWSEERMLARQATDELVRLARASGVQVLSAVETGRGSEVIDRMALRFEADLVVMSLNRGDNIRAAIGPASSTDVPLWSGRPVLVILC